jgi:hypothetical protein
MNISFLFVAPTFARHIFDARLHRNNIIVCSP